MKYRKIPLVVEEIQYIGDNFEELEKFCLSTFYGIGDLIFLPTLETDMKVSVNDWIIRGINGESYPCKPDIFEKTYEKVED